MLTCKHSEITQVANRVGNSMSPSPESICCFFHSLNFKENVCCAATSNFTFKQLHKNMLAPHFLSAHDSGSDQFSQNARTKMQSHQVIIASVETFTAKETGTWNKLNQMEHVEWLHRTAYRETLSVSQLYVQSENETSHMFLPFRSNMLLSHAKLYHLCLKHLQHMPVSHLGFTPEHVCRAPGFLPHSKMFGVL